MNGRTCQLCGKPLSRFTVGSGGDFCSREHRNQFRLRSGMDRLLEANKVASLMRRRENAKAIPAAQLASDCKVLPRATPPLRVPVRPPAVRSLPARTAELGAARVSASTGNLLVPRAAAAPVRGAVSIASTGPFRGSRPRPLLPPRSQRFPVRMPPAAAVVAQFPESRSGQASRRLAQPPQVARTYLTAASIRLRALPAPPSRLSPAPQPACRLANFAGRGQALRVSGGAGFRLPAMRLRLVALAGPRAMPLLHATEARSLAAVSHPPLAQFRSAAVPRAVRGVFGPEPPVRNGAAEFPWPTAILPGMGSARHAADTKRSCQTAWKAILPLLPQPRFHNGATHPPPSATVLPFAALTPRGSESRRRLTLVPFVAQDAPFEYSTSAIHGTLLGGMQFASPASPPRSLRPDRAGSGPEPTPAASLQEHFDAGWNNWLGATGDWKVDAAGARIGSLALFSPSIEMNDYELEFLARIECRSVSWVFRAANFDHYYQATLAAAPGGGYELQRRAIVGGVPEASASQPLAVVSSSTSAARTVTVRMRAVGSEFTLSLDGTVLETWKDTRLAAGGIGFVSAPDDRARLYWVKVTPAGQASKEYRKQ
jgi:hypothetical protein